jgi:hemolysin activation/secretion protein
MVPGHLGIWKSSALKGAVVRRAMHLFFGIAILAANDARPIAAQSADTRIARDAVVALQGVTAYDGPTLLAYAAQLSLDRYGEVSPSQIAEIVELIYREDGFFLAEARLAPDGRTVVVEEGRIDSVSIEGVDAGTFRLMQSYVAPVVGRDAINLRQFERAIMLADDIEAVSVTSQIDYPDDDQGARLRLIGSALPNSFGNITLDNPARALGDAASLTLNQEFYSIFTAGDLLRFYVAGTEVYDDDDETLGASSYDSVLGSVTYRLPVGGAGAFAEGYYGNVQSRRDATGSLAETEIGGSTAILALGYPVQRDVLSYSYGLFEVRRTSADTEIGSDSFDSTVNVISATWLRGKALNSGGAYEFAVNLSFGEQGDPEVAGFFDGDETFAHLRFAFGYTAPLPAHSSDTTVRAELWGQWSNDSLPGVEKFYLGGRHDERGYVFAETEGDSGLSATLEIGHDFYPADGAVLRMRPLGFLDAGYVENHEPAQGLPSDESLVSVGLGFEAEFKSNLFLNGYAALPLRDGSFTDAGDASLYLALAKSW